MPAQFNDAIRELIQNARIVRFSHWQSTHPAEAIALFQAADDQGRYLTDADCAHLQQLVPQRVEGLPVARQLRDQVADIVDEARAKVLDTFPTITQPGGGLFPSERADACWRDFWHFLRCISYGIAGQHLDYTSSEGLHYLRLLYQELQVPLDAMVVGLQGIQAASLKRLDPQPQLAVAPYFEHLITQLNQFRLPR